MILMTLVDAAQILTFIVLIVSASVSTVIFYKTKRLVREKETFDYIDEKFNEYLQICLDKPYLDIFDIEDEVKQELTPLQKKEEKVAFSFLMSIFERVYIFYVENGDKCDCDQLENWKKTIREYMSRPNFRDAWMENSYGWDTGFILFMDQLFFETDNQITLKEIKTKEDLQAWSKEYEKNFVQDANNDLVDGLDYYLEKHKYPYHMYSILDNNDEIAGGLLTQEINNAVIILYIFVKESHRRKSYGTLALRRLKIKYSEDTHFIAEVETRNKLRRPFWTSNLFYKVNFDYHTPEVSPQKTEEKAVVVNDLVISSNKPLKTKKLQKIITLYFQTSFVKDLRVNINNFNAVNQNKAQLEEMGKTVKVKTL